MLSRLFLMWSARSWSLNQKISPLFTVFGFILLRGVNSFGMVVDSLLFPKLRRVKIEKPIIVAGVPRSGTTFLQRFLIELEIGTGVRLWKSLIPSLTLQAPLKPLIPYLEKFSPAKHHTNVIHHTSLQSMETDDAALFFNFFDGFFAYGFYVAWAKENFKEMFDPNIRDTSKRDFSYLEKLWLRNSISEKNDRVVSKMFSLPARIPQFLDKFPDAKIIYLVRDPLATVPSVMSLVTGVLDSRFNFWDLPHEKRERYIHRLYAGLLDLSLRFQKAYVNHKIPHENIMIITYDRLMSDLETLMTEIFHFIDESPSEDLVKKIKSVAEKQRNYKSQHKYNLAKFDLSVEKIRSDYAPIYTTFFSHKTESYFQSFQS